MTLTGLAARNVLRNKFRAVLTILGVVVAIVTFMLLRTVIGAWTQQSQFAAKDRVVTRHKVTFIMTLPFTYVNAVRDMADQGVKTATYMTYFGGKDPKHPDEFFGAFGVDAETYFKVYDEAVVAPDQITAWKADPQGAIVGDVLAKKLGWKPGDLVTLESPIYPKDGDWQFRVAGIYTTTSKALDRSSFFFHWKYLNDNLPADRRDQIGWVTSRVTDPSRAAAIGLEIDKKFDEREIQTVSQDEGAFNASFLAGFSAVLTALDVISLVILAVMGLVLGNTIAMGVRERTNEYGVLKALGFSNRHIVGFIVTESLVIGFVGGLVGVGLGYLFVDKVVGAYLEENMGSMFPFFRVPVPVMIAAMGLAMALAAVASILPAISASRLKTTDALKRLA